jgi:DNA-binding NarL/FixJ family response regulator
MALEGGRMGRWEWDLQKDSMFWCERTCELLGIDKFWKASIEAFLNCVHPEDRQTVKDLIARAFNGVTDFQAEFRVMRQRQEPRGNVAWLALHGDEVTRRIKRHLPDTRVIGLSMFEEPGVARRMRDAGADAYLVKSGPFENLLAAIRGVPATRAVALGEPGPR